MSPRYIAFLLVFMNAISFAESGRSGRNFFFVEAGAYISNLKERLNAPPGYASKLSSFKGYLRLHPGFSLGKNWHFEPSFGTMLPTRDGADGSTSAFESQLALQLSAPVFSFLKFRFGPGIEWMWLLSDNQAVDLNNGLGTSTFYTPSRSTHIFLFTVTGGLSFRLHERWLFALDLYVPEIMSSVKRRYNVSATLGYRL